jgi:hypothetical protein
MNSKLNLTAKARRLLLVTALVACPFLAVQTSNAQFTATATLLSGGSSSISITGSQSLVMTLSVTTNFLSSGYTVFYATGANGNGLFQLVSRTNISPVNGVTGLPVFNDPTTSDGQAFGAGAGILDPVNNFDLGYTGDQTNNQPAGTFGLQTITVNALNAAPGTYTIFMDARSIMTERTTFSDVNMAGPILTITVVPEPATVGLAILGGAMLLLVVWRKQRAQA